MPPCPIDSVALHRVTVRPAILPVHPVHFDMCRRSVRGISSPNIIACVTAHAAFDKASQYFGIELRHARACPATQCIDVAHVAELIDSNTVCLVGSAPQFAHGTVDPIWQVA